MSTQAEILQTKNKLKQCQPYFIEKDLIPKLYFKDEKFNGRYDDYGNEKDTDYWIFYYTFIRKLTAQSIGIRLNFTRQNVSKRLLQIISANKFLIDNFLAEQLTNNLL